MTTLTIERPVIVETAHGYTAEAVAMLYKKYGVYPRRGSSWLVNGGTCAIGVMKLDGVEFTFDLFDLGIAAGFDDRVYFNPNALSVQKREQYDQGEKFGRAVSEIVFGA